MTILTENNLIQNVGKAMRKECTDIDQINDFLQYCQQLIFYENTNIAGTVPDTVINDTKYFVGKLKKDYSIENIIFESPNEDTVKANKIIKRVSNEICVKIDNINKTYKNKKESDIRVYLPKFSPEIEELVNETTEAIKNRKSNVFDKYLSVSSFKNDSCFFKIMKADENIIDNMFKIVKKNGWNKTITLGLIAEMRFMTNRAFALEDKQSFLPSRKRSKIINVNKLIYEKIDSKILEMGTQFFIKMPSLKDYLIERSNGDPKDILEYTCELRKEFKPFRSYINKNKKINQMELDYIINEIIDKCFSGYKKKPLEIILENLVTVIVVNTEIAPIPIPILNLMKIKKEMKINKCVQVFGEVIDDMENRGHSDYEKLLIKNCMKN